jgi:hypothetical protein
LPTVISTTLVDSPRAFAGRGAERELSVAEAARLGRLLAASQGYQVRSREGQRLGLVDHIRYERHSDHPDEVVVRRPYALLFKPRFAIRFQEVERIDPRERTVTLRIGVDAVSRRPST